MNYSLKDSLKLALYIDLLKYYLIIGKIRNIDLQCGNLDNESKS